MFCYAYDMHADPTPIRPTPPSRRLSLVAATAATASGVLVAAHPRFGAAVWSRGDDLALLAAWASALAASAWLFVITAACRLAIGSGRPDVAGRLAPALPFGLRGLVEIAVLATCVALPALPANATTTTTTPVVADQPVVRTPVAPHTVPPTTTPTTSTPPPTTSTPSPVSERVVVRPGDNLWLIARTSLTRVSTRRPTEAEVMRHWLLVIAANRSTLRSGDPSLVFPGEIVTVPPPPAVS
jgi:hypothetical protein